ncbi:MAG TPA: TetR family transcriptional regulator C-terminal domain-containing protein [Paracoccaceae bacterium]|nr:TetR family transcriptional regulator C-terminal domain-containing protein [Paracoccaceae bacterium]HMO72173.1 TetR family transcriptional regulator C-terminal domain-containing protein [Paracoccaceae bacterium]
MTVDGQDAAGGGQDRRAFRREGEAQRRADLIGATLALVAEGGLEAATVRAIAARAGVTPGLIRHYFAGREDLIRAAYAQLMHGITDANAQALDAVAGSPEARLAAFVAASLRPPVMALDVVTLWAGFLHMVRRDPRTRAIHAETYHAYRDRLEALIADLPGPEPGQVRALAIAGNAVIDGLWLEGAILPDSFGPDEIARIGLQSVGRIVGADLEGAAIAAGVITA